MGAWEWVFDAAGLIGITLLVAVLFWSARLRAEAHREWAAREQERGEHTKPVIDWCVATWAVAGCL